MKAASGGNMAFSVTWKILNFQRKECLKYFNQEKKLLLNVVLMIYMSCGSVAICTPFFKNSLHWVIFLTMSHFGEENGSRNLWRTVWPQAHFRKCKMYLGSLEMENYKDMGHLFCSITETHSLYIPWSSGYLANFSFQAFILRVSLFQRKNILCVRKPIPSGN